MSQYKLIKLPLWGTKDCIQDESRTNFEFPTEKDCIQIDMSASMDILTFKVEWVGENEDKLKRSAWVQFTFTDGKTKSPIF